MRFNQLQKFCSQIYFSIMITNAVTKITDKDRVNRENRYKRLQLTFNLHNDFEKYLMKILIET